MAKYLKNWLNNQISVETQRMKSNLDLMGVLPITDLPISRYITSLQNEKLCFMEKDNNQLNNYIHAHLMFLTLPMSS